jgi:hypothetical protein
MKRKDMVTDDLMSMHLYGEIVDITDPEKRGRARVKVFGKFDELDDEDIPWAEQSMNSTFGASGGSGSMSVPKLGAIVNVYFDNGNLYTPFYYNILETSKDLLDEVGGSYEGAHSLIYDGQEDLKIFYTREKGLTLSLKDSRINIASDNAVTIEHVGTSAIIELRGGTCTVTTDSEINLTAGSRIKGTSPEIWMDGRETKTGHVPSYSQVLGEPLFAFLKTLSAAVDAKLFPSPGAMASAAAQAEALSLSRTCKISK